jgi:hypothetical protein
MRAPRVNPVSDLQTLARAPMEALRDLAFIADALQALPGITAAVEPLPEALRQLPAIEKSLRTLIASLEPALADVRRLREVIETQHQQVIHIDTTVQRIDRRTRVLERSVRALPDPDDDRGPLAKAREALTGA